MTDKHTQELSKQGNMEKDPADWVTGDEPMTGAQRSYLKTLSEEAKQPFDESLTKAEASSRIDELQSKTGRGSTSHGTKDTGSNDDAAPNASPPAPRGTPAADGSTPQSLGEALISPMTSAGGEPPAHGSSADKTG